jgi:hypothetical protein
MQDERSCPADAGAPLTPTDASVERGVLSTVVGDYPEIYTEAELVREVAANPESFGERDTIKRAIRSLDSVGLLHRSGPLIFPSRAALRFDSLEELSER